MPVAMETITLKSVSFDEDSVIPKQYSAEGRNISPELEWSGVPEETRELVLMMEDPDGSAGTISHWLVYNISPQTTMFPEGIEPTLRSEKVKGILQGKNSLGKIGYSGPLPMSGSGVHHYLFLIFAMDQPLDLEPGLDKEDVQKAMYSHIIARGVLTGTYER